MALSSDGRTLAIGGPGDDGEIGAAWIFVFDGSSYQQFGDKLVGTGSVGSYAFQGKLFCFFLQGTILSYSKKILLINTSGYSVALSSDGRTLAVGGPGEGATWIFSKNGSSYQQIGDKLVSSGSFYSQQGKFFFSSYKIPFYHTLNYYC